MKEKTMERITSSKNRAGRHGDGARAVRRHRPDQGICLRERERLDRQEHPLCRIRDDPDERQRQRRLLHRAVALHARCGNLSDERGGRSGGGHVVLLWGTRLRRVHVAQLLVRRKRHGRGQVPRGEPHPALVRQPGICRRGDLRHERRVRLLGGARDRGRRVEPGQRTCERGLHGILGHQDPCGIRRPDARQLHVGARRREDRQGRCASRRRRAGRRLARGRRVRHRQRIGDELLRERPQLRRRRDGHDHLHLLGRLGLHRADRERRAAVRHLPHR